MVDIFGDDGSHNRLGNETNDNKQSFQIYDNNDIRVDNILVV